MFLSRPYIKAFYEGMPEGGVQSQSDAEGESDSWSG